MKPKSISLTMTSLVASIIVIGSVVVAQVGSGPEPKPDVEPMAPVVETGQPAVPVEQGASVSEEAGQSVVVEPNTSAEEQSQQVVAFEQSVPMVAASQPAVSSEPSASASGTVEQSSVPCFSPNGQLIICPPFGIDPNRRYDQNTYLGTHNAFANPDYGYLIVGSNQSMSIIEQLTHGVRLLNVDLWAVRQKKVLLNWQALIYQQDDDDDDTIPQTKSTFACDNVLIPCIDYSDAPLEIVVAHNPWDAGWAFITGGGISYNYEGFSDFLEDVSVWLLDIPFNSREVVTLTFENRVPEQFEGEIIEDLNNSRLAPYLFYVDRPNVGLPGPDGTWWDVRKHGFPTLNRMADYGKRVVLSQGGLDSSYDSRDFQVGTVYGNDSLDPDTWTNTRQEGSNPIDDFSRPLFSMEHAPDFGYLQYYDGKNDFSVLNDRWGALFNRWHRLPQFVKVDFFEVGESGGPRRFVAALNTQWETSLGAEPLCQPCPLPNGFGWHNSDVTLTLTGTNSPRQVVYTTFGAAPNSAVNLPTATPPPVAVNIGSQGKWIVSFAVIDESGRRSNQMLINVWLDKTLPTITWAFDQRVNANGWHNSNVRAKFGYQDALSGVDGPDRAEFFFTAEGANQSLTVSAADRAGNVAEQTIVVNIDKTPPLVNGVLEQEANANGWHNADVFARFKYEDPLSGIDEGASTPRRVPLTAEGANQTVTSLAVDRAGNSAQFTISGINIDKTPPMITGSLDRSANTQGWYNAAVTAAFTYSDTLSGIDPGLSTPGITLATEGANQAIIGAATDRAGNVAQNSITGINIDTTPPVITLNATAGGAPYAFGAWTNQDVLVTFACTDGLSGIHSCPAPVTFASEGANLDAVRQATDEAGNIASVTVSGINIDKTPPTITGSLDRDPNAQGWYNADVTATFAFADALSGIDESASTPSVLTLSTEGANQSVTGIAADKAGNTSQHTISGINIDKTPPTVAVNQAAGQADPTNVSPILFDVVFSEPVSGFDASDVILSGPAGATTAEVSGSGATYSVAISGMTGDGAVVAEVAAGGAADVADNGNEASTSADNTVTYIIPKLGNLILTKVVNWSGATPDPNQVFTICIGEPSAPATLCHDFPVEGGTFTFTGLAAGEYVVTENPPGPEWTVEISGSPVTVPAGGSVEVTITNTHQSPCTQPDPERDLSGVILDGPDYKAQATNSSQACEYVIGYASYKKFDNNIDHQELFAANWPVTIRPGETLTLEVARPDCATQIDLFYGDLIESFAGGVRYGTRLLAARHLGGTNFCQR